MCMTCIVMLYGVQGSLKHFDQLSSSSVKSYRLGRGSVGVDLMNSLLSYHQAMVRVHSFVGDGGS